MAAGLDKVYHDGQHGNTLLTQGTGIGFWDRFPTATQQGGRSGWGAGIHVCSSNSQESEQLLSIRRATRTQNLHGDTSLISPSFKG